VVFVAKTKRMEEANVKLMEIIKELKATKININSLQSIQKHKNLFMPKIKFKLLIVAILLIGLKFYCGDLLMDKNVCVC
jgi:hypothetical protein